jgi:hypothetical protein
MNIETCPEFGIELALVLPYAYHLHTKGELDRVITSKGMRPYYYFCDDVHEQFTSRTIDNEVALRGIPNQWIHHNALAITGKDYSQLSVEEQSNVNGVLDYREWICPPYKEVYKNAEFEIGKPTVFIMNKYNVEHGEKPLGYFDIKCLYDMFNYFRSKGYSVIYKRATNKESEFTLDQNEMSSLDQGYDTIRAEVDGIGEIDDFQLAGFYDNVHLIDDLVKDSEYGYNETQLKLMANCENFISVCGGNSVLSSMFGGTVISYVHKGKELRPNYFSENSYFRKLSGANVIPAIDGSVVKTGVHDYSQLFSAIESNFK